MNVMTPYVDLSHFSSSTPQNLTVPPPNGLPAIYIVGPLADTPPSTLTMAPSSSLFSVMGPVVAVSPGGIAIMEGLAIANSAGGLQCSSPGSGVPTQVTLLRSFIGGVTGTNPINVAIIAYARCQLTLDSSWIGKGPGTEDDIPGNYQAMKLDSTQLSIVNTVFWQNGNLTSSTFGGISLTDTQGLNPLVRIVNTSFVDQLVPDGQGVLAIDCQYLTKGMMTTINTLFVNPSAPNSGDTYVRGNCRPSGLTNPTLVAVASDDGSLMGPSCVTNVDDSILMDPVNGNLHFGTNAPATVTGDGVLSALDSKGAVPIPTVDMEGKSRGPSQISIGAFEITP
jgi:hypothetical protein